MKGIQIHASNRVWFYTIRIGFALALLVLARLDPVMAAPPTGFDPLPVIKVQLSQEVTTPESAVIPETEAKLDPMATLRALSAYLTPEDINELSLYLRDVVVDILRGTQDATLPPDLAFKLAVLEQRFRKEGDVYMQQALRNLDRDLRRFLQGLPVPIQLPEFRAENGN